MSHIEFIGPPGAGKSALYRRLVADTDYVGWDPVSAVQLATSNQLSTIIDQLPDAVVKPLCRKVWHYWAMEYLYEEFCRSNPSYQEATETAMSGATTDRAKLQWLLKTTTTKFHVAAVTAENTEQVCLDEGFYQRSLSVARRNGWKLPTKKYFDTVPEPSTIILITAPTTVCLERQHQRGSIIRSPQRSEHEIVEQIGTLINEICAIIRKRDINIIEIKNVGDVEENIKKIKNVLK